MPGHLILVTINPEGAEGADPSPDHVIQGLKPGELGRTWFMFTAVDRENVLVQLVLYLLGRHPYQQAMEDLYRRNRRALLDSGMDPGFFEGAEIFSVTPRKEKSDGGLN